MRFVTVSVLWMLIGCGDSKPAAVEKSQAKTVEQNAAPAKAPVLAESDVRAAVERWLVAQNSGALADYQAHAKTRSPRWKTVCMPRG